MNKRGPAVDRGAELNVLPGTNRSTIIGPRYYSGHALDKMQSTGITPSAVENTILRGMRVPSSRPNTIRYYDPINNVTVVTNSSGGVVTAFPGGGPDGASGAPSVVPGDDE